jgi:hypothetical protein
MVHNRTSPPTWTRLPQPDATVAFLDKARMLIFILNMAVDIFMTTRQT